MANSKEKGALSNGVEHMRASEDRIYVDNSSLVELKTTCDEAVERVSTKTNQIIETENLLLSVTSIYRF